MTLDGLCVCPDCGAFGLHGCRHRHAMTDDLRYKVDLRLIRTESDAERAILLDLLWKLTRGDWHGVSDAANDLRVEEAKRGAR